MKTMARYVLLAGLPWLASCASRPMSLAPVGPAPALSAAPGPVGHLQVFTETEEYDDDDLYFFRHSDYEIYTPEGKRLKRVWNWLDFEDESPTVVKLPVGKYVIKAAAEYYGLVSVPVLIKPNQTTTVILQPGWKPEGHFAPSAFVRFPNGYFVGWRADLAQTSRPQPQLFNSTTNGHE